MRYFITGSILVAGALAQSTEDYLKCASAAIGSIDTSTFTSCKDKTSQECFCANKSALEALTASSAPACTGLDLSTLASTLCNTDSDEPEPARHASKPMQPANKRAEAAPRVVYVTETRTDCSCKNTPVPERPVHISQIPVDIPASSSMASMASSTPGRGHGLMGGAASSFGSKVSGPTASAVPSGVDPTRFSPFQGAAAAVEVHAGVAVLGVAAVMAVMVAL
ncbi:unnamed protein product [Penicillium nalgiovense]|uniref:Extracellular membrane protein CFEM domain-containing protein n=1 Tax=Penicillium nalgiovense TaxID=60175 RepID=A0A1V6Y811_PENNA|nr:hypothetical protein PENNAL_c0031G01881 [Penicillium nalgiovense]CAG7944501.1 unnamed protein product [Penicillium nalgiovense]CAG7946079.1 unnamed protein product [Penicillium nalgiovense]CAG7979058.1 unnamed protein product [Penicillium nalgiovense]CAG8000817.1 unnamed protein product [Penicillium nalgiovense]